MISLDNEPDLWQSTHARLRGDGNPATQDGNTATYAEMVQRTVDYASAAKDVNPAAHDLRAGELRLAGHGALPGRARSRQPRLSQVLSRADGGRGESPPGSGWSTYSTCTGIRKRVAAASQPDGRLPHHRGGQRGGRGRRAQAGAAQPVGSDIYRDQLDHAAAARAGRIRLLPRLKDKITAHYPGTKLAITEYNYGGANHISGAIAQADVLGIFGREGLFAATLWRLASNNNFIYGGFEAFRNYDGANGSFGDTSIRATNSDVANASVYASVNAGIAGAHGIVASTRATRRRPPASR